MALTNLEFKKLGTLIELTTYKFTIIYIHLDYSMIIFYFDLSGLQPDQPVTAIQIKLLIPKASYHMNTNGAWKVFLMSYKPRGSATINFGMCVGLLRQHFVGRENFPDYIFLLTTENLEFQINLKINVVRRNGEDYMTITETSLTNSELHFEIHYEHEYIPAVITSMVTGAVNFNFPFIKPIIDPFIDRFIANTIHTSILQPIFDKISLQQFFNQFFI